MEEDHVDTEHCIDTQKTKRAKHDGGKYEFGCECPSTAEGFNALLKEIFSLMGVDECEEGHQSSESTQATETSTNEESLTNLSLDKEEGRYCLRDYTSSMTSKSIPNLDESSGYVWQDQFYNLNSWFEDSSQSQTTMTELNLGKVFTYNLGSSSGRAKLASSAFSSGKVDDGPGFRWRKYGQARRKGYLFPRHYYKCETVPGCQVRKTVEISSAGDATEIIYKNNHNHPPPHAFVTTLLHRDANAPPSISDNGKFPLADMVDNAEAPLFSVGGTMVENTKAPFSPRSNGTSQELSSSKLVCASDRDDAQFPAKERRCTKEWSSSDFLIRDELGGQVAKQDRELKETDNDYNSEFLAAFKMKLMSIVQGSFPLDASLRIANVL